MQLYQTLGEISQTHEKSPVQTRNSFAVYSVPSNAIELSLGNL